MLFKFAKRYWDLVLAVIIIIYHFVVVKTYGTVAFNSVFLIGGIILMIYHFIKDILKSNIYIKKLLNLINVVVIVSFIIFSIVEVAIYMFPKEDISQSDYLIVLGAGVKGKEISLTLKHRLDKAIEYSEINKETPIIVSGGQGSGEDISEAEAMKRYLLSQGINYSNIIMEDKSTSTSENLKFSKVKIEEKSNKKIDEVSVKIITSDFHALRGNMLAKREGYNNISFYTNETIPLISPIMYTREFFAIVKSYLLD